MRKIVTILALGLAVAGALFLVSRFYVGSEILVVLSLTAIVVFIGTNILLVVVFLYELVRSSLRWIRDARRPTVLPNESGDEHALYAFQASSEIGET